MWSFLRDKNIVWKLLQFQGNFKWNYQQGRLFKKKLEIIEKYWLLISSKTQNKFHLKLVKDQINPKQKNKCWVTVKTVLLPAFCFKKKGWKDEGKMWNKVSSQNTEWNFKIDQGSNCKYISGFKKLKEFYNFKISLLPPLFLILWKNYFLVKWKVNNLYSFCRKRS